MNPVEQRGIHKENGREQFFAITETYRWWFKNYDRWPEYTPFKPNGSRQSPLEDRHYREFTKIAPVETLEWND